MEFDYDKDELCDAIYDAEFMTKKEGLKKVFWFDKVILTSGKISAFYIDHRNLTALPQYARLVVDAMEEVVRSFDNVDFIVSSESAGVYWGAAIADRLGYGFISMRKELKWCGGIPADARPIGIDDLNTTLGTLLKLTNLVYESTDEYLPRILIDLDREEYDPRKKPEFESTGTEVIALLTARDLIGYGLDNGLIDDDRLKMVNSYRRDEDRCAIEIIVSNPDWVRNHARKERALKFYENNEKVYAALQSVLEV